MQTKSVLTLDDVKIIAAAAEAEAKAHGWAVVIAIVDDGGHLMWLQCLDGVKYQRRAFATPTRREALPRGSSISAEDRRASIVHVARTRRS